MQEPVTIVPYDPKWPEMFEQEKTHLLKCLPRELIRRVEHFGSTAIPGMAAKPIIDMLVEVTSLEQTKKRIVPVLEGQGYEYLWRPTWGDDTPPFYAWFIKRNSKGDRTHHIHMIESDFEHWNQLMFRDYLIANPDVANKYQDLKMDLWNQHRKNRTAYTRGKTAFILQVMKKARAHFEKKGAVQK